MTEAEGVERVCTGKGAGRGGGGSREEGTGAMGCVKGKGRWGEGRGGGPQGVAKGVLMVCVWRWGERRGKTKYRRRSCEWHWWRLIVTCNHIVLALWWAAAARSLLLLTRRDADLGDCAGEVVGWGGGLDSRQAIILRYFSRGRYSFVF